MVGGANGGGGGGGRGDVGFAATGFAGSTGVFATVHPAGAGVDVAAAAAGGGAAAALPVPRKGGGAGSGFAGEAERAASGGEAAAELRCATTAGAATYASVVDGANRPAEPSDRRHPNASGVAQHDSHAMYSPLAHSRQDSYEASSAWPGSNDVEPKKGAPSCCHCRTSRTSRP